MTPSVPMRACLLGGFCAALFLCVNFRKYATDVAPIGLMPVTVLRGGALNMDGYRPYYDGLNPGQRYMFVEANGHLYPMKPFAISLLAVPFYAPPVLCGVPTLDTGFWIGWGRLLTALLTGASVGMSYAAGRRWGSERAALVCALLLGLGTCYWTTVGQVLNYHVGGVLCVSMLVLLIDRLPLSPKRVAFVGFLAGAAVGMRPTTVVLLLPLGLYLLLPGRISGWKAYVAALVGVAVVPALNAWWNVELFGSWSATGYSPEEMDKWSTPFAEGFAGQLIAPNSGLFVQSPFLMLAVVGAVIVWRSSTLAGRGLLRAYSLCFLGYLMLFARWHDWQGGLTPASRMLCEGYPLLLPLIVVGWEAVAQGGTSLLSRLCGRGAGGEGICERRPSPQPSPAKPGEGAEPVARRPRGAWLLGAMAVWSIGWQLQGIAIFDDVVELDPPNDPWRIEKHFLIVYLRNFGSAAALLALGKTVGMFLLIAATAFMLLTRGLRISLGKTFPSAGASR